MTLIHISYVQSLVDHSLSIYKITCSFIGLLDHVMILY